MGHIGKNLQALSNRKQNEDELDRLIGEWTCLKTAEEVESLMQQNGVAANIVETGKDIYEDSQMAQYGHFRAIDHPVIGMVNSEIPPFKFSKSGDAHTRAPLLGRAESLRAVRIAGDE